MWACKYVYFSDMTTAGSGRQVMSEAILYNGMNPNNENESLLIKYFPKTGVEEEIAQFEASKENSMIYLEG